MNYVLKQVSGNHFCLIAMIILGGLVALNIVSLGVLAVIGGQTQLITCLNLVFRLHFCFNHIQKRKRAWKQKTRLQKRQSHLSQRQLSKQLTVVLWLSLMGNARSMDASVASQVAELARAATRAAEAASQGASSVRTQNMNGGMEAAANAWKNPDIFNGGDPASFMNWKLTFETWMTYGDDQFSALLSKVEKMPRPPQFSSYDSDPKTLANKFFASLNSYLRGRTSALVRSVASAEKDGFRLWYELQVCKELLLSSKHNRGP